MLGADHSFFWVPKLSPEPEPEPVTAQRWRIYITANGGHTNSCIAEIVFKDDVGTPISYSGGTASASSAYSGSFVAANAFDGSNTSRWATLNGSAAPSWIEMQFSGAVEPHSVDLTSPPVAANDMARDFAIEYYDGSNWISLASFTNVTGWTSSETRTFLVQGGP